MRRRAIAAGLIGVLGLTMAAALAPQVSAATPAPDPVSLGVTSIQPLVLTAGGTFTASGTIVNNGTDTLSNLSIQLRLGATPVGSRSELDALVVSAERPPGDVVPGALVRPAAALAPGGTLPWTLTATAKTLGLTAPGVYPLSFEVIADDPVTGGRTRYGTARTFLPWDLGPTGGARPTRVAVLWPVLGIPSRGADGAPLGSSLRTQLAGRLAALLQAAGGSHLTWLLDGDTLESIRALADTPTPGPGPTPSTASPTPDPSPSGVASTDSSVAAAAAMARAWLEQLGHSVANGQVAAVPYADPDLVAAVRSGRTADLTTATTLGAQVVAQALGATTPVGAEVAWPADGTVDGRTLTALAGLGTRAVILSDEFAAPARAVTTYTPSGVGPISGTLLTGIVADNVLSTLLATPTAQQGGPALAQQRMLAELAMVTAELPAVQRSLVIVPPRRWTPEAGYVRRLLDALGQVPWVQPATLDELQVGAAEGPIRQRPVYPKAVQKREIGSQQFDGVRAGTAGLDAVTAVVADPAAIRDTYERALLRSESTVWRAQRPAGLVYIRSVVSAIDAQVSSVRVVQSGALTLAARSGKIPVTVENRLSQTVTMHLSVAADPAVRLTLTQPAEQKIPAGESRTFEVPAEATTNGSVQLIVRLLTPEGKPYGSVVTFPVQITGLGAVAQLVVGGAFVLLAVALVVRVGRAIRRGRRPGSEASVRERAR